MTKRKGAPAPIDSFGPWLLAAFQRGATEPFVVAFASKGDAVTFRRRMHQLRVAMRFYEHPLVNIAEKVIIRDPKPTPENSWQVLVEPADRRFEKELKAAGIDTEAPSLPFPDTPMLEDFND